MVRKTRAQSVKAAERFAAGSDINSTEYVDNQLQEITAYFEARQASGGLIDITKEAGDKINGVLDYCQKTQEHVKQSSIEKLVSCIGAESAKFDLSPEAFTGLLDLFLLTEPCEQRIHGLNLLLDIARHGDYTSITEPGTSDKQRGSRKYVTSTALIKSLEKRLQEKSDDKATLETLAELLVTLWPAPLGLVTDSPLDVRVLPPVCESHMVELDVENKRKRDEIPDSLEEPPPFDMASDVHLETLDNEQSSPKVGNTDSVQKPPASCLGNVPNSKLDQNRPSKRLKRVTETGSPIPIKTSSKTITVLAKQYPLNTQRQEQTSRISEKEEAPTIYQESHLQSSDHNISKEKVTTSIALQNKSKLSHTLKQVDQSDMPKKGEQLLGPESSTEHSSILRSPRRFSALESASQHTDQALFDQYIDLEHGMVIVAQPPENIFSSPQRQTNIERPEETLGPTPKSIPATDLNLVAQLTPAQESATISKEWAALKPLLETEAELDLHPENENVTLPGKIKSVGPLSISPSAHPKLDASRLATLLATERTIEPQGTRLSFEHPIISEPNGRGSATHILRGEPVTNSYNNAILESQSLLASQDVDRFVPVSIPRESRPEQVKISLADTRNNSKDKSTSTIDNSKDRAAGTVSVPQLQQCVAAEVEKAIKGLGAFLCSTSYQDLILQYHCHDTKKERLMAAPLHKTNWSSVLAVSDKELASHLEIDREDLTHEKVQLTSSTPRPQLPGLRTQLDPNKIFAKDSNALPHAQGPPEMVSSSTAASAHAFSPGTAIPDHVAQQVFKQVQGLKAEMIPSFLVAITLLANTFHALGNSTESLTKAIHEHDKDITKRTLDHLTAEFEADYERNSISLASRIKKTVETLDGLQACCDIQTHPDPAHEERHTKSIIDLIDVAAREIFVQGDC